MDSIANKMQKMLPKKILSLLRLIGKMAQDMGYTAFAVGGFVRDLIMGRRNFDVDIVIEGNAIKFGKVFADRMKGALVVHRKFGTSTVVIPWGPDRRKRFKVDFATARKERYKRPAALPEVDFSSLRDDLYRRDFTINAMAIDLSKKNFGELVDFFGGREDLKKGIISALHEGSFIDDPTRIFRAVRFEQRFGFRIDRPTQRLIKSAIKEDMFKKTSGERIRDELILMLKEKDPRRAVMRMSQLDELRFIHPRIKVKKGLAALFKSIKRLCRWHKKPLDAWLIYMMALFENLDTRSIRAICDRFALRRNDRIKILSYKESGRKILRFLRQKSPSLPSQVYKRLHPFSHEAIILLLAKAKGRRAKGAIIDFLLKYNNVKIKTTGDDLKQLGFKPGPNLGKALEKILYAKINGKLRTKKDELAFAKTMVK